MNFNKIVNFYQTHRIKLIISLIIFIIAALTLQLYIFFAEKINEEDMKFEFASWTETCDGTEYTFEDNATFCSSCFEQGGKECNWPFDMNITVSKVEKAIKTGGEVHCYTILDNVNLYTEYGSYYGLDNNSLFTWEVIDSRKGHVVEFCCGIQRESPIATLINLEKKWPQACIKAEVGPKCIPEEGRDIKSDY